MLTMILPLITAPYAARVLTVDGIGIYSYTHSYSMYFTLFAALGTGSYGLREIARHRNDRKKRSQLFWEIFSLTFVTSSICILAWGAWILLNQQYRIYYVILTFTLLGTMFDISWFYNGLEEFKYTVSQNSICKILGTVAIFLFVKEKGDLWIYTLILSLTIFLANISMWIYLPKFVDKVDIKTIRIKKHFRETLVYFIPTIAISIYTILDKTLIGLITHDTSENGNYEQATKIVNMAKTVSFAGVNVVIQSRISYLFTEKKIDEIKRRIATSMDYMLFMGVGLTFGIIGIANRFVPFFFGPGYDKTIQLLCVLAPLTVIVGVSNCLGSQYYNPAGLRARSAKFIIAGSVVNLILNLTFIPVLKSIGASIATLIAESTITFLYIRFCDGFFSWRQLFYLIWKKVLAGIAMMIAVLYFGTIIEPVVLAICAQFIVGVILYSLILLIIKDSFVVETMLPLCLKMIKK